MANRFESDMGRYLKLVTPIAGCLRGEFRKRGEKLRQESGQLHSHGPMISGADMAQT